MESKGVPGPPVEKSRETLKGEQLANEISIYIILKNPSGSKSQEGSV